MNMKLGVIVLMALALQVAAIATPNWEKSGVGLWKNNTSINNTIIHSVRALTIISAIFMLLALNCILYPNMIPNLKKCECMLLCLAGLSSLVAMVIWNSNFYAKKLSPSMGYSSYLNVVAGVMALGVCAYMKYY